jgi:hypothetical protein
VKLNVPVLVGVPVMSPVLLLKLRPGGKLEPDAAAHDQV